VFRDCSNEVTAHGLKHEVTVMILTSMSDVYAKAGLYGPQINCKKSLSVSNERTGCSMPEAKRLVAYEG
jgi:hypothetical protein